MSDLNKQLTLHLALDEIQDGQVPDDSGNSHDGVIRGAPQLVADDIFGSCLRFDGVNDYVDLPVAALPPGSELSVSFWAKGADSLPKNNSVVGAGDAAGNRILNIHLPWSNGAIFFDCGLSGTTYDRINQPARTPDIKGQWTHWAFTKNAVSGEMKIYINGALWLNGTGMKNPISPAHSFKLGCDLNGTINYPGTLAHFRVYSRELSAREVGQIMDADQTADSSFRKTHPLGFNLFDDDDQQALYIADKPTGHNLNLEIHNTSQSPINLVQPISGAEGAAANQNHFELRFRPGALLAAALSQIKLGKVSLNQTPLNAKLWHLAHQQQADGSVSLYFLVTEPLTMAADSSLKLNLQNISADGRGGARGTRVELKYRQMTYTGDATPINGTGIQHISIVNERGKKNIPLHVGFVGSNTILNDGTENQRILRITNLLRDGNISLSTDSDAASKFILSFDVYEEQAQNTWALGKKGSVWKINIDELDAGGNVVTKPNWLIKPPVSAEETPEWIITPLSGKTFLAPNESVQFRLSNIRSDMRSGPANVYLRYENLTGYWDGQFITTLEKSNLIQRDQFDGSGIYANKSYVGIGTADPKSKLHVIAPGGFGADNADGTSKGGNVPIVAQSNSTAIGIINGSGRQAFALNIDDDGATNTKRGVPTFYDRFDGNWRSSLSLKNGNIGVGINDPTSKLHVAGDSLFSGNLSVSNGNVGIGTGASGANRLTILGKLSDDNVSARQHELQLEVRNGLGNFGTRSVALGLLNNGKGVLQVKESNVGYNDLLLNPVNGNVGIGTSDPKAKLHAIAPGGFGADNGDGTLKSSNVPIVAQSNSTAIGIINGSGRAALAINIDSDGGTNATRGVPTFYDRYDGNWHQCLSLKNGNVGVGASDPGAKLHVAGDALVTGKIIIGDWTLETRHDNAWGSPVSALFITWNGRTIARFGTIRDMFQISRYDSNGNYRGYSYINEDGDIDSAG